MAPGRRTHGARCVVRRGYDAAMMATHGYHRSVSPRTPIAAASTKTRCRAPVLNSQSPVPATLAACLPRFVSIRFFIHVHGILGTCAAFSLLLLLTTRFLLRKALQLHRAFRNAFHFAQRALADPWVLGVNIRRSAISLTLLVIPFSISLPLPLPLPHPPSPSPGRHYLCHGRASRASNLSVCSRGLLRNSRCTTTVIAIVTPLHVYFAHRIASCTTLCHY